MDGQCTIDFHFRIPGQIKRLRWRYTQPPLGRLSGGVRPRPMNGSARVIFTKRKPHRGPSWLVVSEEPGIHAVHWDELVHVLEEDLC